MTTLVRPARHVLLLAVLVHSAAGQVVTRDSEPRLPAGLGSEARLTIQASIDSLRLQGLPAKPLADKAAEGVLKGATDQQIVAAVRTLSRELRDAHAILNRIENVPLLLAVASALHAGVSAAELRSLIFDQAGDERPRAAASLESALVTLVDLVSRGVAAPTAVRSMESLLRRNAAPDVFASVQREVESDIQSGLSPEAAMTARTNAHVRLLGHSPPEMP